MNTKRRPTPPDVRAKALKVLAAGKIGLPELAKLLDVSRQMIWNWCREARIDWRAARTAAVESEWRKLNK